MVGFRIPREFSRNVRREKNTLNNDCYEDVSPVGRCTHASHRKIENRSFLPIRDSPSLTRTLPTSSCPYVARIPTLSPILFPNIEIFSSRKLSPDRCLPNKLINEHSNLYTCQSIILSNHFLPITRITSQAKFRSNSRIIREHLKERRKHSTLSLSFVFSSSFPLPSQSAGGSKERIIEKESDAFSRRAWRIPNSDWQLINTASRHSRGQLARPRYRNAIFIAGARARAPIHPHAHTQYRDCARHIETASYIAEIDLPSRLQFHPPRLLS